MAIDIGIGSGTKTDNLEDEPRVWFDADGYYWFIHPLLQDLAERTGLYIDLYGYAAFGPGELMYLQQLVSDIRALIAEQPLEWDVHCGTQIFPENKEIFDAVSKSKFVDLVDKLQCVIDVARASGKNVVCIGD